MLLVAEFEIDRAPKGFSRRFCEALSDLIRPQDEATVTVVTTQRCGQAMRRIECDSAQLTKRLKAVLSEIDPSLMEARV